MKNKTLGVVDVGKQTFFYVKDNPKEAYAVLKNEALKLKENSSSFVGNAYSSVVDGVTNTTGPEKMHFVAKNVFQTLAWRKALGAVGMLGKAPRHAVCSAITESERQAGVMLFAEKYGVRVQEIPRCCLKNAPTSITREAVGMAAANQIIAHEGRQLLALANNGAVVQSLQLLTQLPRIVALKATAEATLSTNIFGSAAGAATSTAISANANAALVAGVVEKTLATDMAQAVTAAEINIVANATQRLLPAVIDKSTRAEYSPLLMQYPTTVAVKIAAAETVGKALAKEVVKGAVTRVAELNLTSHAAQTSAVAGAV